MNTNNNIEYFSNNYSQAFTVFISFIIASILIISSLSVFNIATLILIILLTIIIFIMINNINGKGYENSLSPSTYPLPPTFGHDGISLNIIGFNNSI